jgi:UDP-galactopyranose mutase
VPQVPESMNGDDVVCALTRLIDEMYAEYRIRDAVLWYYTPMALAFTSHLKAQATVYDCMDELSLFSGASPRIRDAEAELLTDTDVVFTGGISLYEAKRNCHANVHAVPSSIDIDHFKKSRIRQDDPADQEAIPHPRLGFAGVLDERFDIDLLNELAVAHPEWHFVMVGPIVKVDPARFPRHPNIHYLGQKAYADLPAYLAGWDVALLLFARNDATRYISPTKTPEYLAAGLPVVSTSIRDVVRSFGHTGLVHIADAPEDFAAAISEAIKHFHDAGIRREWLDRADKYLKTTSWDQTWARMMALIDSAIATREVVAPLRIKALTADPDSN